MLKVPYIVYDGEILFMGIFINQPRICNTIIINKIETIVKLDISCKHTKISL